MGGTKVQSSTIDVDTIRETLPSARRHYRRAASKASSKPIPASLPVCFAEVWRHRQSSLPAHRRERATLEAVASTIPSDASSLTGEAAAAVYLAALLVALRRLVATTAQLRLDTVIEGEIAKPLSKKDRKKLKRRERLAEEAIQDMNVADALGTNKHAQIGVDSMLIDKVGDLKVDGEEREGESNDDVGLMVSMVYLIGLSVRGSSQAVLNTKCESILAVVMQAYDHVSGRSLVERHTGTVFASVLAALDASSWTKPTVQRAFLYLLRQTSSRDAKSRRKAREALDVLLKSPRASIVRNRTSKSAVSYFAEELKLEMTALEEGPTGATVDNGVLGSVSLIYLLTSIERFGIFLDPADAAKVSKEVVLVALSSLPVVNVFALNCLSAFFKRRREAATGTTSNRKPILPQLYLEKILEKILEHRLDESSSGDAKVAYGASVSNGAKAYASYFDFSSPPDEFIIRPVKVLCDLIARSEGRGELTKSVAFNLSDLVCTRWFRQRQDVLTALHMFTSTDFRVLWPDTTPVLKRYLEDQKAAGALLMSDTVRSLATATIATRDVGLKGNDKKAQDMASGILHSLVRGGAAECIWQAAKVEYDKKLHLTNAWILPILREGLCGAPFMLFHNELLPLAEQLRTVREKLREEHRDVEAKNVGIYFDQVWGLLPGFCNSPSDLGQDGVFSKAFGAIHSCLTSQDGHSMQTIGVAALRLLSESVLSLNCEDAANLVKKKSFAARWKKLFPILTELAENTLDDRRDRILQAATKACQAVADSALVSALLRKVLRRLLQLQLERSNKGKEGGFSTAENLENCIRKQHAAADLAIAIAESNTIEPDAAEIDFLEKAMSPFFLDSKESSLQKKAYKATTMIIGFGSLSKNFSNLSTFSENTAQARFSVAPGAKAARQGLIVALVNQSLKFEREEQRPAYVKLLTDLFLPEIILGTRDMADKTRSASFETLIVMARTWNSLPGEAVSDGLRQFIMAVAAGLGGKTVPMLSATLSSLGRLMYEFQEEAATDAILAHNIDGLFGSAVGTDDDDATMKAESDLLPLKNEMIVQAGPIAILLRHSAPEVQKAALGVVKVATKVLAKPISRLTAVLPGILPGLVHVAARSKKQETRLRVRVILERLLRKCGREVLEANFPPDHIKLLSAVRKKYSRELIKKHEAKDRKREARKANSIGDLSIGTVHEKDSNDDELLSDSDSDIERELLDGDELLSSSQQNRSAQRARRNDVVNLLDAKGSHSILARDDVISASREARLEEGRKRFRETDTVVKYSDDGRPIFVESDEESGGAEVGSVEDIGYESGSDGEHAKISQRVEQAVAGKKRQRDVENKEPPPKKVKGSFGEEYKSKRAHGDVKRAGRPDPYAYVPLGANMGSANPRQNRNNRKSSKSNSSLRKLSSIGASRKQKRSTGIPGKR